jgi:Bacterial Ig-like domain
MTRPQLTGNNLNQNTATITQNDPAGYVNTYYLRAQNSGVNIDGQCDVDADNPATFSINTPTGVTATPNTLTFEQCGTATTNTQDVTFTSDTPNSPGYTITATQTSGPTGGGNTIGTADATFRLQVNPDTTKPTVTAVTPTGQSESVNTNVTATFSEAMKASTINGTTFTLKNTDANTSVPANVGYDAGTKTATLTPQNPLANSTNYEARVTTGAQDLAGNGLLQDRTWSFKTAAPACTTPDNPAFSGSPNGDNGWYKTTVPPVSATSSAGATVQYSLNAGGPFAATAPTLGQGTTTVYAKAVNGTCSSAVVSNTYKVDTAAPVISRDSVKSGTLGLNDWYTTDVEYGFTASDPNGANGSGLAAADQAFTTGEGSAIHVSSGTVKDLAGRVATAIDSPDFKIDKTAPTLAPTVNPNPVQLKGGATVTANPTDGTSGVNLASVSCGSVDANSVTAPNTSRSVSCSASDNAGLSNTKSVSYTVVYSNGFGGFLQPINADGTSRFKLGSTIPVKFQLKDATGAFVTGDQIAQLAVNQSDTKPDPGVDEAISTAASTTGNWFRYDATSGQHIFNLSTKSGYTTPDPLNPGQTKTVQFTQGTWTLWILLNDGTSRSVKVQLVR